MWKWKLVEFGSWYNRLGGDESLYWLEILNESGITSGELLDELLVEADELVAIFTSFGKKAK